MLDVSCILINYNTSRYSLDCINSIIENTKDSLAYEIVVVDNTSKMEDYTLLKEGIARLNNDKVKLVRSKVNTGFGGGNMMGVQFSSPCKYYAFVNNDTLFESTTLLLNLSHFMENNPDAGVCSPQMVDEHKNFRRTLDHFASAWREIFKRGTLEFINPKRFPKRKKEYQEPIKVDYVQGAFMFINAEDFNSIGGFDTNLFLYYEESDVCRRILKDRDKNTYLVPSLKYIHYTGASTSNSIAVKIEQKISLFYYIRKHFSWFHYKIVQCYFSIRYFFSSWVNPKYWKLFILMIQGMPLSKSIRQHQTIQNE
jgi:GT2 family glycosyltransferase